MAGNILGTTVLGDLYLSGMTTSAVAAMTVTGNKSVTTTLTWSGCTIGDFVFVTVPTSGLSNGITVDAWVNAVDTVTLSFSNVSSASAVQSAATYSLIRVQGNAPRPN